MWAGLAPSEGVRSLFQASLLALGVCRCNGAPWKMVRAHVVAHMVTMRFGIKSLLNMKPELKPQPYNSFFLSFFFFFFSRMPLEQKDSHRQAMEKDIT